ncbi:MAG: 3-dehydroquinate synthase [Bacteroidales bacterium]|nr:3-dehydroquinate synthase [Bacteroidales bacterium]MBN2762225.1 3-dehydroquinate synthase [Bacteroidales bacterium]
MRSITITTENKQSHVLIGERLQNLRSYLPDGKVIIITDDNILRYYAADMPPFPIISIGTGEKHKTLETLVHIFEKLIEHEADRTTYIVGIGGGIVCDVAGFAASVYMRGLRFGFVSSTLLSQVDASVGGKNGVNFRRFKNMLGVFNQPEFVICDPFMLKTLEKNEFIAGFAEIVKAGAIKSAPLFEYLEANVDKALSAHEEVLEKIVYESVRIKADVVENDEKEKGLRRILNFGHTFAHAFENMSDLLHGEAVSMGMVLASRLSCKMGYLSKTDSDRIENLLSRLQLPVKPVVELRKAFEPMKQDKKREGNAVFMVFLKQIGEAVIEKITYKNLEEVLNDLC